MENVVIFCLLIGVCCIPLAVGLIRFLIAYSSAAERIRMELGRTEGKELRYWKRERRALRLMLIPFMTWHRAREIAHKGHPY